jgi:hypothetical protein
MNDIRTQCINMLVTRIVNDALENRNQDTIIAHLLIFGKSYCLSDKNTEELLDMVWDEYQNEFEDSEEAQAVAEPDKATLEAWIMKQTPYNWLGQM